MLAKNVGLQPSCLSPVPAAAERLAIALELLPNLTVRRAICAVSISWHPNSSHDEIACLNRQHLPLVYFFVRELMGIDPLELLS